MNDDKVLLFLKLRNCVAEKEFITAQANRELTALGSWSADWTIPFLIQNDLIEQLIAEVERIK